MDRPRKMLELLRGVFQGDIYYKVAQCELVESYRK